MSKPIEMIKSRKMRFRHLRELDREKGWEEADIDEGIILKWSLKVLVEGGLGSK